MGAIFGSVGVVDAGELAAMGARLAHRGGHVRWWEIAPAVHLGCVGADPALAAAGALTAVIDAPPAGAPASELLARLAAGGAAGLALRNDVFALAAWDARTATLALARDFAGLKPLYYCLLPGASGIAFASEYKALLALASVPARPDLEALQYLQCHKRVPEGRTLLADVRAVLPAALQRFSIGGVEIDREAMPPLALAVTPVGEAAASEEIGRRFLAATRRLVTGQSRIGVALSGGIDSIGVAYACRRSVPGAPLTAFTAGHGPEDPEIRTAALVAERLGAEHCSVIVTAETLAERLPETVWHLEDPIGRSETVQFLELGRTARERGFDLLVSGMSADALFAGMPRHKLLWLADRLPPLRAALLEFHALTQSGRPPGRPLARLLEWLYFRDLVGPVPRIRGADYRPGPPELPPPGPEFLNRCLLAAAPASTGLARMERPLQASGVDFVTPFTERALMDYAFTVPDRLKIRRGREKYILRRALRALVPAALLDVPKFPMRMRYDASFAASLDALCERYLSRERIERRGLFAFDELQRLRGCKRAGQYSAEGAMRLWTAVGTEIWAEQFLDRRGARGAAHADPMARLRPAEALYAACEPAGAHGTIS